MASIQKQRSGKWRARHRDEGGREHARHFERKIDAQRWLDSVAASVVRGDYVDPRAGRMTVREYAGQWSRVQVASAATTRIRDNALRLHILPALGDHTIGSVLRSDIQGFVKSLSARLAPGSVRNVYEVLSRMMLDAVDDKVISSSPCTRRISLPKGSTAEIAPPSTAEVIALAAAVPDRFRALTVFLAGSGLRIGEALAIDISDVDFLRRSVRVERQLSQNGTFGPPKGNKARTVPLGHVVIDALAEHLAAYPSGGPMFTTELGERLTYRQWKGIWNKARTQVKVAFTTHNLRHYFASALISGGASVKQVQASLGHSSPAITLRVYSHLFPGDDDRTRETMDAALGALANPAADSLRTGAASIERFA